MDRVSRYRRRTLPYALSLGVIAGTMQFRSFWRRERSGNWFDYIVKDTYSDCQWTENFRMKKATFQKLCDDLDPFIRPSDRCPRDSISVEKQVAITLYWLASSCEYRTVGNLFGVSTPAVCRVIHKVCQTICSKLQDEFIQFPEGEDLNAVVRGYREKFNYPNCGGAIDGCHIEIIKPENNHGDYVNRKQKYSLILQGVCDDRYLFREINIGWPGKVHDARVLANSNLYTRGESGTLFPSNNIVKLHDGENEISVPVTLIGDPAYPLRNWTMKPFVGRGSLSNVENMFNYRLSRARMTIENCFGRLKGRWRVLMKRLDVHVTFTCDIIATCCILHNFCETMNEDFDERLIPCTDSENSIDEDVDSSIEVGPPTREARITRDLLAGFLLRNAC